MNFVSDATLRSHVKVMKQIKKLKVRPRKVPILPHVRVTVNKSQNILTAVKDEMKRKMVQDFVIKQYVKESLSCNYSDLLSVASNWVSVLKNKSA
jgi:16S rRNA U516 pseudouridylate synthase RsuA-like enzyme